MSDGGNMNSAAISRLCAWMIKATSAILFVAIFTPLAYGQFGTIIVAPDDVDISALRPTPSGAVVASSPETASSTATTDPNKAIADRKARRLAMIRKLSFDRRPSAILKTWQSPPSKDDPLDDAPADAAKVVTAPPAKPEPAEGEKPKDPAAAEKAAAEAKQAEAAKIVAAEDAAFDRELTKFQRQVTLSEWDAVRSFIANLELDEAKALYAQMLTSLQSGSSGRMNVDPQMLQQLVTQGADLPKMQAALSSIGQGPGAQYAEKNLFTMSDILGVMQATPGEFDDDAIRKLGMILQFAVTAGFDLDALLGSPPIAEAQSRSKVVLQTDESPAGPLSETKADTVALPEKLPRAAHPLTARDVARLLTQARQEIRAGEYLPSVEEAIAAKDGPGLNLIVRHVLAKYAKEQKSVGLEQAWQATQAVLEIPVPPEPPKVVAKPTVPAANSAEGTPAAITAAAAKPDSAAERLTTRYRLAKATRDEALTRAVELAPKVRKELGQQWLDDSFRNRQERGKELLSAIGSATSNNLASHPNDSEYRKKGLELQKTAVEALTRASSEQAAAWREPLTVLAAAWLKEATTSHALDNSAADRGYRRDRYGNYFMFDDEQQMMGRSFGGNAASPIKIEDVLELKPTETWLALVSPDLRPKFEETLARLHLKMQDEALAFPYIERLAATHPSRAKDLAAEFVKVWTSSHNPNENRNGYNPYYYYYSYERRADRIPLTRSKQERNLVELAGLVKRLKSLPIGDLNETLLTNAFTTVHSKAEVYRLEAIESVFGSIDALKPRTLAELIQQMRGNLAGVWRMPDVQRQNSTNRKQRDIRAEVLHGYEVARTVVQQGQQKYPGHWALILAEAAMLHDENEYLKEFEKSSDYSPKRTEALELFAKAAKAYVTAVPDTPLDEQTPLPFEMWFYASLGSVDLARITADKTPDHKQPALIRQTLAGLSTEAAERHLSQFANNLFTRASDAKPELKQRYLKAGFEVVGEHKLAREARKLHDYYNDLIQEIKLETRIDGPDTVGHGKPFGVFVNLVHTKEIERESGGFGKYLQNQNNNQMYYYNFGRPLENYRDKFSDFARKALADHFDVLSVTFQEATVNSRALPEYGWRSTPYAYLLLKAKGPEIDKLASLRMDLDFLDTSGYAVLPIESPVLPLDAKASAPPARPAEDVVITQTLDERQSDKGKLLVEIRVTARGLVPEMEQLLDLKPTGFTIDKIDDRGVAVVEFDKEAPENSIRSERQWMVALSATTNEEQRPKAFQFASAKLPVKEMVYQRYEDADLKSVDAEVSLEARYGKTPWLPWALSAAAVVAALLSAGWVWHLASRRQGPVQTKFTLPTTLTPFTAISFLKELEMQAGFDEVSRRQLQAAVTTIERHYFQTPESTPPNIEQISQHWLTAALAQR